ncbi:MAG: hypothetical protein R3321_10740, partial [Nitrososphaeraceae archaeon]|nr:hypothetical protein [Nitrososphaeraceae archaeon]
QEFSELRDVLISEFGDEYQSETQFSVGSLGITVSSWFVDALADNDFIVDVMKEVSSVQIGVYENTSYSKNKTKLNTLIAIDEQMKLNGWKNIINSIELDELTLVYLRANKNEQLKRMFVINSNGDELVLLEVEGDLKDLIDIVIHEKGLKLKRI